MKGTDDKTAEEVVPYIVCSGSNCEHAWDGPAVEIGRGASVICSKCQALYINESLLWG